MFLSFSLPAQVVVSIDSVSSGLSDGRFTLGANDKKLLYGYPNAKSTSHFVIAVEEELDGEMVGKFASNSSSMSYRGATYMSSETTYEGNKLATTITTTFLFRQIEITQKLIPIDKDFQTVTTNNKPQYYLIEYTLKNLSPNNKKVGLLLLLDTMIDDNDDCVIDADKKRVSKETAFIGKKVPNELLMYRTAGDREDMLGICITTAPAINVVPADEVYVGRYEYFEKIVWDISQYEEDYEDSAIIMKWLKKDLAGGASLNHATIFGLPKEKPAALDILIDETKLVAAVRTGEADASLLNYTEAPEPEVASETEEPEVVLEEEEEESTEPEPAETEEIPTSSAVLYFGLGKYGLDADAKAQLDELFKDKEVASVIIKGYSDAVGNGDIAIWISKKRIDEIKSYLNEYNLELDSEVMGNEDALINEETKVKGNAPDRKAEVIVQYKK